MPAESTWPQLDQISTSVASFKIYQFLLTYCTNLNLVSNASSQSPFGLSCQLTAPPCMPVAARETACAAGLDADMKLILSLYQCTTRGFETILTRSIPKSKRRMAIPEIFIKISSGRAYIPAFQPRFLLPANSRFPSTPKNFSETPNRQGTSYYGSDL